MLHQIQNALDPVTSLTKTIVEWNSIAIGLADPPRKRKLQMHKYQKYFV
jgi:hypothetical protein